MKADDLLDHSPLKQGKYKGQTPDEVSEHDPSYVVWMYANWTPKPCSKLLAESCKSDLETEEYDEDDNLKDTFDRFTGDLD